MYEASNEENLPVRVLKPETELRSKRNLVQSWEFSEMLKKRATHITIARLRRGKSSRS